MSRKIRSTFEIKSSQGYAIGHPPYGYKYDEIDKKRWTVDEEATDVVRHIFKQGESVNGIAKILKKEKIYISSVYAIKKGFKKPLRKPPLGEYLWTHVMVSQYICPISHIRVT